MDSPNIAFRKSLRGRLLFFVLVPTVVIFGAVIVFRAINTFRVVSEQAQGSLRRLADQVAAEVERGNTRAVLAAQMMAFAQEEDLFGKRRESSDYARRVLDQFPELTGAYFGYEPNADGQDADFVDTPAAKKIGRAFDPQGRFLPYWFRTGEDGKELELTPLIEMETSLYYNGCREQLSLIHI